MLLGNVMKRLALLCLVVCWTMPALGASRVDTAAAEVSSDLSSAIASGVAHERSRQWVKAIEHYETSLKQWPESNELKYGLRRSKTHFGIERRYSDSSFESQLLRMSQYEALDLFTEVLNQVQSAYVDSVTTTSFVAHGTESLYLALVNPEFAQRNLRGVSAERINKMRQTLRESYWNKPIADRYAARNAVNDVCGIARQQLGIMPTVVVMEYLFGGCNALDDYSNCLTPDRLDDLYGNIRGEFVGLGIEMKSEVGEGLHLVNVLPESPAAEGGLRPGDYIVRIDGTDCTKMTTDEAARLLRGPAGSRVRLELREASTAQVRTGDFVRRAVTVKSIPVAKIVDPAAGVGYIQLTGFQETTPQELDSALQSLKGQGMRSLVLDVRQNPGGLLTAAVEVLDRFIADGVLVSTRGRTMDQNMSYSARRQNTLNMPLVLLVDGDSASASEVVAGAIRDYRRGHIVGQRTYGKWSVQSIFPVHSGIGLRLTTAKFYSPHGHTLGKIGVEPDVVTRSVGYRPYDLDSNGGDPKLVRGDVASDPDLKKAIELLGGRSSL